MSDFDDLEPRGPNKKPTPRNLEPMSVEELRDYIERLKAEITRAEAQIAAKQSQAKGAASLFKF